MLLLTLKSYWTLARFHVYLGRGDLKALFDKVRSCVVDTAPFRSIQDICLAIDIACISYPKVVLCLQRSAATTYLLKRNGIRAQLVVGARPMPFRSHAWVEVDGMVVNDKPYVNEIYPVLDRF